MNNLERAREIVTPFLHRIGCKEGIGVPDGSPAQDLINQIAKALDENVLQNGEETNASQERVTPIDWPSEAEVEAQIVSDGFREEPKKHAGHMPISEPWAYKCAVTWLRARIEGKTE